MPSQPHAHDPEELRFCPRCGGSLERRPVSPHEPERLVCLLCRRVLYEDPKVVAGVVIERDGRILLLRRAHEPLRGRWVFPSGYVDRGEKLEDAAVREAREETGLNPRLGPLLGVYSYSGEPVVVVVWIASAEGEPCAGEEALEIAWFRADSIPWAELAFPSTSEALRRWVERHARGEGRERGHGPWD